MDLNKCKNRICLGKADFKMKNNLVTFNWPNCVALPEDNSQCCYLTSKEYYLTQGCSFVKEDVTRAGIFICFQKYFQKWSKVSLSSVESREGFFFSSLFDKKCCTTPLSPLACYNKNVSCCFSWYLRALRVSVSPGIPLQPVMSLHMAPLHCKTTLYGMVSRILPESNR